jgi:drug/metabolite transporter (DMT)-like permease
MPLDPRRSTALGTLFGLGSALFFSLMALFVRLCGNNLSDSEILFVRSLSGILILSFICGKDIFQLFKPTATYVWLRACFGGISVYCYFFNIRHSTLGMATILTDLSPVFVVLFSAAIFKIRVRLDSVLGVVCAMLGVACLSISRLSSISTPVLLIGLLSAASGAAAYISLKQASERFSVFQVLWAFSIPMAILGSLGLPRETHFLTGATFWFLVGVVICSYLAQLFMTFSYKLLSAPLASTLGLTAYLWALLFDCFLGNLPTWGQLGSITLIIAGIKILLTAK